MVPSFLSVSVAVRTLLVMSQNFCPSLFVSDIPGNNPLLDIFVQRRAGSMPSSLSDASALRKPSVRCRGSGDLAIDVPLSCKRIRQAVK